MKNRILPGVSLIVIGTVFLLQSLGVISVEIWREFGTYWPIGLILIGIALIFQQRWLAALFLALLVIGGVLYLGASIQPLPARSISQEANVSAESLDVELDFGAGELIIKAGRVGMIRNDVTTTDDEDPVFRVDERDGVATLHVARRASMRLWGDRTTWRLALPPIPTELELDFGAAETEIDLTGLHVDILTIDSGATDTEITFADYPTRTDISTGASSITLGFPANRSAIIDVDGGAVTTTLDGFTKRDDAYYYDAQGEPIIVEIDAGASSVHARII